MKVFIDTNILLGLYQLSGPDLDELKKIVKLAENEKIEILLPQQVADEFWRNRERVIREALDTLSKTKAQQFLPNLVRQSPKVVELREAVSSVNSLVKEIRSDAESEVNGKELAADKLIKQLLKQCEPVADEVVQTAILRHQLGNPPGKKDSLGDAVNWEWLLSKATDFDDLTIISSDGDYESELVPAKPREFLVREWENVAPMGELTLYKGLPEFLKANFPDIKLSDEIDKFSAIDKFENSFSFATTHRAIAKLNHFDDFTAEEIHRLVGAFMENGQVRSIFGDGDVTEFAQRLVQIAASSGLDDVVKPLKHLLGELEDDSDDGIPF